VPKALGYGTKVSTTPLPSMSSPTPSLHTLTAENASQLLASMQPQPPTSYAGQYTPPKGAGSIVGTNQGGSRTPTLYGNMTSPSVNRTSPVSSSTYCSNQQVSNNQTTGRTSGISSTGYAKVTPSPLTSHASMSISLGSPTPAHASSSLLNVSTSLLHSSPSQAHSSLMLGSQSLMNASPSQAHSVSSLSSPSFSLPSPTLSPSMSKTVQKSVSYFTSQPNNLTVSAANITLPTIPVPSSASISHQVSHFCTENRF